jgi:hypothetical protein
MTITNPLVLPEIREALAPFLPCNDLARCIKVCKAWHASFISFLWRAIEVNAEHDKLPSLQLLQRHCSSIESLVYHGRIPKDHLTMHYPALRTLLLLHVDQECKEDMSIFLAHSPLTHLELRRPRESIIFRWIIPTSLASLTTLRLTEISLLTLNIDGFWRLCSQLETMDLDRMLLIFPNPPTTPWKMKDLSLTLIRGMTPLEQLSWISRCPDLRRLKWDTRPHPFPRDDFVQSLMTNTWPKLEDLHLKRSGASDRQMSLIIGGMRRIIGLSVSRTQVRVQAQAALRFHFPWLRRLNIVLNITETSEFIVEVLRSCPQLESLKADSISGDYFLDDAPWACERSLKTLEICFEISPTPWDKDRQQSAIVKRLMRLSSLERLDLTDPQTRTHGGPSGLEFRLERGLEQLATLTRLKEIVFYPKIEQLAMEDVEWMIKHWKNLKSVKGKLSLKDVSESLRLANKFSEAGIDTKMIVDQSSLILSYIAKKAK